MTTDELLTLIGPIIQTEIICDRYGDASLHDNDYISADPCYLEHLVDPKGNCRIIRDAIRNAWVVADAVCAATQRPGWREFDLNGERCYYRDCSDGTGFFNHSVDSGAVVVMPLRALPEQIHERIFDIFHLSWTSRGARSAN